MVRSALLTCRKTIRRICYTIHDVEENHRYVNFNKTHDTDFGIDFKKNFH